MFKKSKKDNGKTCVTLWVDNSIIKEYQAKYPRTFSAFVRYYLLKALENENIVKQAIFNDGGKVASKTIFEV